MITVITSKLVSPNKIITSINHLITRGALSPTTLFACEAHELYTFTRKFVGPPASQNTFLILTGRNVVHCTSAKENMKSSNQIALLRRTKTIYTVALFFYDAIHSNCSRWRTTQKDWNRFLQQYNEVLEESTILNIIYL